MKPASTMPTAPTSTTTRPKRQKGVANFLGCLTDCRMNRAIVIPIALAALVGLFAFARWQSAPPDAQPTQIEATPKRVASTVKVGELRAVAPGRKAVDRGAALTFREACTANDTDVVTLAMLGDIDLQKIVAMQVQEKGWESIWSEIAPFVQGADIAWANLEGTTACCQDRKGNELPDPKVIFDGSVYTASSRDGLNYTPKLIPAIQALGIDVLSTANNHSLDRGVFGATKTIEVLRKAKIPYTGTRLSANEPWHTTLIAKGMKIAFLGCTEWSNRKDPEALPMMLHCRTNREEVVQLTRELATSHDAVVVTLQGGSEDRITVDRRLHRLAVDVAEAGATIVSTFHPHYLQTWEKYDAKDGREVPFLFCRGNFLTFNSHLEGIVSTMTYVGLTKDKGEKARAVGVSHVPIAFWPPENNGARSLVLTEGKKGLEAAHSLAQARFGRTRLHPAKAPVDVRIDCKREPLASWSNGSGDLCLADEECAADLSCVAVANNGMCTKPCAQDAECPTTPGASAVCAQSNAWGTKICARACTTNDDCLLTTECKSGACEPSPKRK